MQVALTVADFLNRGAEVYGARVAVVDEPEVAGSLGAITYTELEARARGMALHFDALGVAQGERVWFEAQSSARLVGSADYRNAYIFQLQVRGGRIVEYKEFADTLHIWRVIDDPRTRGPAIARQPFLTTVTRRLVGNAVSGGSGQVA